ncbi:unnamed protein product, partial [Mesorhabditis belari]|uniref:Endonuclease/exonuclease/phosphatase domain-containing protein n=1 Tax=Mesorhabditis belari TaxID=2138241 RepID=A0AAF3FKW8_9BILA
MIAYFLLFLLIRNCEGQRGGPGGGGGGPQNAGQQQRGGGMPSPQPNPASQPASANPTASNNADTCPNTRNVMSYDSSKLAVTLNDAMKDFPNLLQGNGPTLTEMLNEAGTISQSLNESQTDDSNPMNCNSADCSGCWLNLVRQFAQQGDSWWQNVYKEHGPQTFGCPLVQSVPQTPPNQAMISQVTRTFPTSNRGKRQATTTMNSTVIGTTANVQCYQRGDVLPSGGNWCGLCSMCWRFRQLPSNYFPRFINEIGCVDTDNLCLSSFGTCRPVTQPVEVMMQTSSGWQQLSVQTLAKMPPKSQQSQKVNNKSTNDTTQQDPTPKEKLSTAIDELKNYLKELKKSMEEEGVQIPEYFTDHRLNAELDVLFLIETRIVSDASYAALRDAEENDLRSVARQIHSSYQEFIYPARSNKSGGLMQFFFNKPQKDLCARVLDVLDVLDAESESDTEAKDEEVQQTPGNSKPKGKEKLPAHYHEACSIELFGTTYILGYRNNVSGRVEGLIDDITNLRPEKGPFVILGDFNTTNVKWNDGDFEFDSKGKPSRTFLEEIGPKGKIGCNKQYIKVATSEQNNSSSVLPELSALNVKDKEISSEGKINPGDAKKKSAAAPPKKQVNKGKK